MKTLLLFYATILGATLSAQTTWYKIPTPTTKKLNTIDFPSSKVGYIGGDDGTLLKSTDGGKTWGAVTFSGVTMSVGGGHILGLDFVTETTGFMAVGPYGAAYKTTDGGSTWAQVMTSGNLCYVRSVYFFDAQNGFVGGSSCFQGENINKITAGVAATTTIKYSTWNAAHQVADMDFLNSNFGLAASQSGNFLRTTDGGATWDSIPSGQDEGIPLTSVAVINNTLAYAGYNNAGGGFGILRTTDGGLTWAEDLNSATFYYPAYLCVHEAGNGTVYSGAQPSASPGGLIFENTGGNWAFSTVAHPINDMSSYSNSNVIVFGVGDSGYVVVNHLPSALSLIENEMVRTDLVVYPNPLRDVLNVEVPEGSNGEPAILVIYSASGQVIHESRCSTDCRVDMSAFPEGLYLVELRGANFRRQAMVIKK